MNGIDIFGGVIDAAKLGYNLYTNKRDFDYQQAIQKQIFEREDTAVQRRMADLQAAGLNPNLAAGSAASAGSVVSRSNTNDLGSALDTVQAINSIRQQRQAVENAKIEKDILNYQKFNQKYDTTVNYLMTLKSLGFEPDVYLQKDGDIAIEYKSGQRTKSNLLFDSLDYQAKNLKNSADILQKDNEFYTADKITGYLSSLLPNIGFSFGKRLK